MHVGFIQHCQSLLPSHLCHYVKTMGAVVRKITRSKQWCDAWNKSKEFLKIFFQVLSKTKHNVFSWTAANFSSHNHVLFSNDLRHRCYRIHARNREVQFGFGCRPAAAVVQAAGDWEWNSSIVSSAFTWTFFRSTRNKSLPAAKQDFDEYFWT